jgi:aryl-alcohol dehydrogenase-like predicted oxidoreductase
MTGRDSTTGAAAVLPRAPFGSTGHESSRCIFGAAALSRVPEEESLAALELVLARGVNHVDTAASYGDAEVRLNAWLRDHRRDFFLATKTGEREYGPARDSIRRSLDRMGVDSVDLIQLHNLVHPDEWDVALGPGGALEAAIEARDEGLVRFIGVTGHGIHVAAMHRRSLERFPFDAVLLPYNVAIMRNEPYAADFERLLATCVERGVAVQTIKAITRGPWGSKEPHAATWYEPLTEQEDIDRAVSWVLGRPVFLNTVGDLEILPRVLDAAARFERRPSDEEMEELEQRLNVTSLFV